METSFCHIQGIFHAVLSHDFVSCYNGSVDLTNALPMILLHLFSKIRNSHFS